MRAYVFDDIPYVSSASLSHFPTDRLFRYFCSGDQRKPHDSGENVDLDRLKELGVLYWQIPQEDGWEGEIGKPALRLHGRLKGTYERLF
jgi:hypothetical protein